MVLINNLQHRMLPLFLQQINTILYLLSCLLKHGALLCCSFNSNAFLRPCHYHLSNIQKYHRSFYRTKYKACGRLPCASIHAIVHFLHTAEEAWKKSKFHLLPTLHRYDWIIKWFFKTLVLQAKLQNKPWYMPSVENDNGIGSLQKKKKAI